MGVIVIDILVFLGILFLLVLIITPLIYYFEKQREDEKGKKGSG